MSRKLEDFDEYCDPNSPKAVTYTSVIAAAKTIAEDIVETPCVASQFSEKFVMALYYKMEMLQKSGSFKARGAANVLRRLPLDKKKIGVVIGSSGNEGHAMCYYASKWSIPIIVVMPSPTPISKVQVCLGYGARVVIQGNNLMESQKYARAIARDKGLSYINGRDHPDILSGYGTVGIEIIDEIPEVDAVIVPIGSGGLAAAVSSVIKRLRPECLVIGVQAAMNSTFFTSLENEAALTQPIRQTLADSIAVPNVGVNAFHTARYTLDKMLLVNEDMIARAMLHLVEKERRVVEASAACTLAGIIGELLPELKTKTVVCVLTGGNVDGLQLSRCLERGLSAEGRLVKFKVQIKDDSSSQAELFRLLQRTEYNVVQQFQIHRWIAGDQYRLELRLVCECKDMEHALELKRIMERAYPHLVVFETEPFNDSKMCPCYVYKHMPA